MQRRVRFITGGEPLAFNLRRERRAAASENPAATLRGLGQSLIDLLRRQGPQPVGRMVQALPRQERPRFWRVVDLLEREGRIERSGKGRFRVAAPRTKTRCRSALPVGTCGAGGGYRYRLATADERRDWPILEVEQSFWIVRCDHCDEWAYGKKKRDVLAWGSEHVAQVHPRATT